MLAGKVVYCREKKDKRENEQGVESVNEKIRRSHRKMPPTDFYLREQQSALVRDPGDCRDNKGKPAKCVFSCFICGKKIIASDRTRCRNVHWH